MKLSSISEISWSFIWLIWSGSEKEILSAEVVEIFLIFIRDKKFNFFTCGCFSFLLCLINDQKSIWAALNSWRMVKVSTTDLSVYQRSRQRAKIRWLSEKNEKFSRRYETPHTICRDRLLDIIRHDCQNSPRNVHRLISGTKMITTTTFLLTVYVDLPTRFDEFSRKLF